MGTVSYIGKQKLGQPYTSMVSANGSLPGVEGPWLSHWKISQGNEERQPGIFKPLTKPHNIISAHGSLQGFEVLGLPHSKTSQGFEDQKWLYCLPYRCEYEIPLQDTGLKDSIPSKCELEATSNIVPGSVQKRFLVFDQSSNQTNLFIGSSIASPAQNLTLANSVRIDACDSQQKNLTDRDLITQPLTVISDGLSKNKECCEESEMHEDSEELDALLYSDDSDSEDEETSTAHSPSDITGWWKNQEEGAESPDEVASPNGAIKRKRLPDEESEPSLLRDTACSLKLSEWDDDAESSYVKGSTIRKSHPSEANKRLKRDKIWNTVNTLQNIIPGGQGKDTALILDEAIRYLRFLKVKAKYLGVDMD